MGVANRRAGNGTASSNTLRVRTTNDGKSPVGLIEGIMMRE